MYRPTELRLLSGLRRKARVLRDQIEDRPQRESLDVMDLVLTELMKRQHHDFYVKIYLTGVEIAKRGLELLGTEEQRTRFIRMLEELPRTLDEAMQGDLLNQRISEVSGLLNLIADAADPERGLRKKDLLKSIVTWEADLHEGPEDDAAALTGPASIHVTRERLQHYLRRRFPEWQATEVIRVRDIPGGFAKATIEFEVEDATHGRRSLIMRADQPLTIFHMDGAVVAKEFGAVRVAHSAGIPVAEPLWLEEDKGALGAQFFVSKKVLGINYGDVMGVTGSLTDNLIKELVRVLAQIHATPLRPDDPNLQRSHLNKWMQFKSLTQLVPEYVNYWRSIAKKCDFGDSPTLTRAFNWLLRNAPNCDAKPSLIHGDYGLHNVLMLDGKVSAVLDWEASYVGDPADEFFLLSQALTSHVSQDRLMQWYWDAGGAPISEYRLRYYEVLACLKGPITGYGSMSLIGKHPSADLKFSTVGYRFVTMPLRSINQRIELAEAVKSSDQ